MSHRSTTFECREPPIYGITFKPRMSILWQYHQITNRHKIESNKRVKDISAKSQRRIMSYIDWLISLSKKKTVLEKDTGKRWTFKLSFITLTLPSAQKHPDSFITQEMLAAFIRKCKKKHSMHYYLWKAEAQKNGNIHYHITTNIFVHWKQIRIYWLDILKKYSYLSEKTGHNPPCTEIKAVVKDNDIGAYLAKYISKKEDDKRLINCKIWDCAEELKKFNLVLKDLNANEAYRDGLLLHIKTADKEVIKDYVTLYYFDKRIEDRKDDFSLMLQEVINNSLKPYNLPSTYIVRGLRNSKVVPDERLTKQTALRLNNRTN